MTSRVLPSGLVAVVTAWLARMSGYAAKGTSGSNDDPGAAVGVMRAPVATRSPTIRRDVDWLAGCWAARLDVSRIIKESCANRDTEGSMCIVLSFCAEH